MTQVAANRFYGFTSFTRLLIYCSRETVETVQYAKPELGPPAKAWGE